MSKNPSEILLHKQVNDLYQFRRQLTNVCSPTFAAQQHSKTPCVNQYVLFRRCKGSTRAGSKNEKVQFCNFFAIYTGAPPWATILNGPFQHGQIPRGCQYLRDPIPCHAVLSHKLKTLKVATNGCAPTQANQGAKRVVKRPLETRQVSLLCGRLCNI